MRVLGWRLSLDGDKDLRFAQVFQSLCLRWGLERWQAGGFRKGVHQLCLSCSVAVWQHLWPCSGLAIKTLLAHGGRSSREAPLSASLRWAISCSLHNVPKAAPKVWSCENATCFLSLFCRRCSLHWNDTGTSHPVVQAELLAACLCLHLWGPYLRQKLALLWVDNEAVRFSLVNGSAYPASAERMLHRFLLCEQACQVRLWLCRVPSHSNPADAPSRGALPPLCSEAQRVVIDEGMLRHIAFSNEK